MPKKFSVENTKSAAARERKKQGKEEAALKKQQEIEDSKWKDDNKQLQKKQQRKEVEERKKQEALERRVLAKAILEKEVAEASKKATKPPPPMKVTRAQIAKTASEVKPKEKVEKIETHLDVPLIENINRLQVDGEEARTIEEAITVLGNNVDTDMNPEKRMRAAYNAYETRRLQELKLENPTLRLSQLKQLIFKQWQKAPENPMNQ